MSKQQLEDANYRDGSDGECCGNCHYFESLRHEVGRGLCTMFAVTVKPAKVCDKWRANAQAR